MYIYIYTKLFVRTSVTLLYAQSLKFDFKIEQIKR